MRELPKPEIPAFAPQLAERLRFDRPLHDGLRMDSRALPCQGNQVKRSKMQKQYQTDHAGPPGQQRMTRRDYTDSRVDHGNAGERLGQRSQPFMQLSSRLPHARLEEILR